ncbi:MAG: DEAD/DEAH box helicase, partial [Thermodesulfobacteriota bacterium]
VAPALAHRPLFLLAAISIMSHTLALTPAGHLKMIDQAGAAAGAPLGADHPPADSEAIAAAFAASQAEGLVALAGRRPDPGWPLSWGFWREMGARYLASLCLQPPGVSLSPLPPPAAGDLERLALGAPPMLGAEYLTPAVLADLWADLDAWVRGRVAAEADGISGFLGRHAPLWRQVGRVCFHLAENRRDPELPFAFLATYVPRLGASARLQHQPLNKALSEYAGRRNQAALLRLLEPVQEAARRCPWVQALVDSGDLYHPLAWSPAEAYAFLRSVPELEASGLAVRLPDWWQRRPRPQVKVTIGSQKAAGLGIEALLDLSVSLTVDGEPLDEEELAGLLAGDDGLALLRGRWVEVDRQRLAEALAHWQQVEAEVRTGGLSFAEGMRLLAGARRDLAGTEGQGAEVSWALVEAGAWLGEVVAGLRAPEALAATQVGPALHAQLRPYQQVGVNWLFFLSECGLGSCLADDMGLGKTLQVIALLLAQKTRRAGRPPSLLVLPASLIANWQAEISRFAPSLAFRVLHPAEAGRAELTRIAADPGKALAGVDLVLTTYGMLSRQAWLKDQTWNLIVLDEAQAIRNPGTRQARAVKGLSGRARIALTGTPVENRVGDLWSLFDFLCPGLLGSASRFQRFVKALDTRAEGRYAPLRRLVQPYILRRLKTDRRIIDDLPEKVELTAWCGLAKAQARLYAQAVAELATALDSRTGMERRGLVLASLMRLKQICNHPSQALGQEGYAEADSGKLLRLREIVEAVASRQEKLLLFTQFREMTTPLAHFLAGIFGRPGLVLHGGTPVAERQVLVDRFQDEAGPPFFVLSLKAGGTGLNLTAASHVVHFDRWWNPAVESQATDRAFRIGQKRNVLVHKLVCRGTVEEKIDALIAGKVQLSQDLLAAGGEALLTELDDRALLEMVRLDLDKAALL